jgi:PhoH-like ATPase
VKTIISRAGEGTKIVLTGDIHQIDTPYLDAESNGLSYVIDKVKNNPLFAHITLEKGERSELANLANELL